MMQRKGIDLEREYDHFSVLRVLDSGFSISFETRVGRECHFLLSRVLRKRKATKVNQRAHEPVSCTRAGVVRCILAAKDAEARTLCFCSCNGPAWACNSMLLDVSMNAT